MAKPLYILLKNNNPNLILWEELNDKVFKELREVLINYQPLDMPMIRFFFAFFICKGREFPWAPAPRACRPSCPQQA